MILRPYQQRMVDRSVAALTAKGNTLAVAATGAGKTICMAAVGAQPVPGGHGRQLVLQHRQELVEQNLTKYLKVNPKTKASVYDAATKSMRGDVVFAMAQTLARNLNAIPHLDRLILDEAHHAAAPTWRAIIEAAKEKNPNVQVFGVTATPERSDGKALRGVFDNISDQITIRELVALGFLVPPKAFVIDVAGTGEKLQALGRTTDFADQHEVADILDTPAVNAEVVRHWRERAEGRPTVAFCATVQHAEDVAAAFRQASIPSACVHGAMADAAREAVLGDFKRGRLQVVTNVMVLTEGYDHPPTACIILLRKCSAKGPLVQMVGRGLRTVNPEEHPGVVKRECVVLDFGTSLLTHGDLDQAMDLGTESDREPGEPLMKICPEKESETYRVPNGLGQVGCGAELPAQTKTCPLCGFVFECIKARSGDIHVVELTELDILDASPFRYVDLWQDGRGLMASGFDSWAGVFSADDTTWTAVGKTKHARALQRLAVGDRLPAIAAADDFLREHESGSAAKKKKRWLDDPATEKQVNLLNNFSYGLTMDFLGNSGMSKYEAAVHLNMCFSHQDIAAVLQG